MSCYEMELLEKGLRAQLGYDRPLSYYFVAISKAGESSEETEDYIFHNLIHATDYRMTPHEVETVLEKHGIGLPYELARILVEEGITGGYPEALDFYPLPRRVECAIMWLEFVSRLSPDNRLREWQPSPVNWRPQGTLPDRWYRLDAPREGSGRQS